MEIEQLLGEVPEHWEYTTLGEACARGGGDIQTGPFGSQLHASDYVAVGVPSIMPQNIRDNRLASDGIAKITVEDAERLARYRVKPGDIVYSRRGDVEKRALIRPAEDGWLCGTGCLRVRFGDERHIDPLYASYYLGDSRVREWVVRHAHGATMPNLNTTILSALPFLVPPLFDQQAIGATLGELDDKIELNRKMNETLETMARALFRSWFVDFDPVLAKAEVRDPGLPAHIADLFPDSFEDSERGRLPAGWNIGTLSLCASLNPESWSKQTRPESLRYVDLSNVKWGRIEERTTYAADEAPSRAQRVLKPGDTIIGTVRPGNGSFAFIAEDGLTGSTGFAVLRPLRPDYADFVYLAATASKNIEHLAHVADGGAYPAIRPEVVMGQRIVLPGNNVMELFAKICAPLRKRIAQNEQESTNLSTLRNALLPKLISGEIRLIKQHEVN